MFFDDDGFEVDPCWLCIFWVDGKGCGLPADERCPDDPFSDG